METFNFELFEQGPFERPGERLHVTIDTRGRLFFNRHALEAIGTPEGVALMYDEEKQAIGVLPSRLSRKETYHLRKLHGSHARTLNALNFCRHFGIAPTETLAFQNPRLNHDGILILDLNEVRSVRKR